MLRSTVQCYSLLLDDVLCCPVLLCAIDRCSVLLGVANPCSWVCTAAYRCAERLGAGHRFYAVFSDVQRCVVRLSIAGGCSVMFIMVQVSAMLFVIVPFYPGAQSVFALHCQSDKERIVLLRAAVFILF